jgi:hypothetical protein
MPASLGYRNYRGLQVVCTVAFARGRSDSVGSLQLVSISMLCRQQFEAGRTHDELWNACQLEMVHLGKMHGFMRMYWVREPLIWGTGGGTAPERTGKCKASCSCAA